MLRVLRHLRVQITIVALLLICGAQWFVFQSVAWASMLIANTQHASLVEAVMETFDGEHPCALCHKVADGDKREKQNKSMPVAAKMVLFHEEVQSVAPPVFVLVRRGLADVDRITHDRNERPPLPPPRVV